jgi:hypothetical protein
LNIAFGISGLIRLDGQIILDKIVENVVADSSASIENITATVDRTIESFQAELNKEDWHIILLISILDGFNLRHYTYVMSPNSRQLVGPVCLETQINKLFLRRCFHPAWTHLEYDRTWPLPNWKHHFDLIKWTNAIDFNFNYAHLLNGRSVDNDADWHVVTKPYTLLFFEFLISHIDYTDINLLYDAQWIDVLKKFYLKASTADDVIFNRERDRSVPLHSVGVCNHIIKLDTISQKATALYCADPCCEQED